MQSKTLIKRTVFGAVSVSAVLLAGAAQAVPTAFVQNLSSSTTLLADGFEDQSTGSAPTTANMNPGAAGSAWVPDASGGGSVKTSTAQAFEGDKSVEIYRPTGGSSSLDGTFTTQNSGTLDVRFMVYIPDTVSTFLPNVVLSTGSLDYASTVSITPSDSAVRLIVGQNFSDSYLSAALYGALQVNKWQEWRLTHTIGTDTVTAMIDGVADSFSSGGAPTLSFGALTIVGGFSGGQTFYVDAAVVPEPSSAVLLLLGGVGLIAARRGRRG